MLDHARFRWKSLFELTGGLADTCGRFSARKPRSCLVTVSRSVEYRSKPFGFDGGLVHVGVVEVGNFAGIGTRRRVGIGCFFDEPSDTLLTQID
jgi:hypothetical protein